MSGDIVTGGRCYSYLVERNQDTAKQRAMHRMVPHNKDLSSWKFNNVEVDRFDVGQSILWPKKEY